MLWLVKVGALFYLHTSSRLLSNYTLNPHQQNQMTDVC